MREYRHILIYTKPDNSFLLVHASLLRRRHAREGGKLLQEDMRNLVREKTGRLVLLGSEGWSWPAWGQVFFPEDMPLEWRLTFYNTQFDCVFLPCDQWQHRSESDYAQWAEDTHERFLFLLEGAPDTALPVALADRAICLPRQSVSINWFDGQADIRQLAEHLGKGRDAPLFLLSRDGDLTQIERVRTMLELMGLYA